MPITITKQDHRGRERVTYQGELVFADEEVTVVRCLWQGGKPFRVGAFVLAKGDLFIEHYFVGKPFNVMVIYDPTGQLKGVYCNITAPAEITPTHIRWRDWLLDLLVLPDGTAIELDRDELLALPAPEPLLSAAEAGLTALKQWLAEQRWPLDIPAANS